MSRKAYDIRQNYGGYEDEDEIDDNYDDLLQGILSPPVTERQKKYIKEHERCAKQRNAAAKQQEASSNESFVGTLPINIINKRVHRAKSFPTFNTLKSSHDLAMNNDDETDNSSNLKHVKFDTVAKCSNNTKVADIDDDLFKSYEDKDLDQHERIRIYEHFTELLKILLKLNTNPMDALMNNKYCLIIDYQMQDEMKKKELAQNIWLNLFDFFEYYNNRASSLSEIEERLSRSRQVNCSKIFDDVSKLNFSSITKSMEDLSFKSISDYRRLNEANDYLIKLCYLFCYIEDLLNRIGYCESLYPSLKQLCDNNQIYSSNEFKIIYKSLLIWYNIMAMCMRQCDLFGRLLGFTKRDAHMKLWTWFNINQKYKIKDFERIQSMLLIPQQQQQSQSQPVIAESNKTLRQVSFELRESKSSQLLYNSIVDTHDLASTSNTSSPLPTKLLKLFSYKSDNSSNNIISDAGTSVPPTLNDSIPPSLYTCLVNEDNEDEIDEDFQSYLHHQQTESINEDMNKLSMTDSFIASTNDAPESPNITREYVYYEFIHKRLAKYGLTETCKIILKMIKAIPIKRTKNILKINKNNDFLAHHWMPLHQQIKDYINEDNEERNEYLNDDLQLPTFRPLYLFLLNSILDLMSTCMKMYIDIDKRINEEHNFNFSILSTEQLTNECRECIQYAIIIRQMYYYLVFSVLTKAELDANLIENILSEQYDINLNKLIQIYLQHVINWVHYNQNNTNNNTKALCVLEYEWNFCKNYLNLCFLSDEYYAKRFCSIISGIIESICQYLNEIDSKYKQHLIELLDNAKNDEFNQVDDNYDEVDMEVIGSSAKEDMYENYVTGNDGEMIYDENEDQEQQIHILCNSIKIEIRELREQCIKALNISRLFMNDLELAAKYEIKSQHLDDLLKILYDKNYVLCNLIDNQDLQQSQKQDKPLIIQQTSFMIFVPSELANDKKQILRLLYMTSSKDDVLSDQRRSQLVNAPYLIYLELSNDDQLLNKKWPGMTTNLNASLDIRLSIYQHLNRTEDIQQRSFMYCCVAHSSQLQQKRVDLKKQFGGLIQLIKEKSSFHPNIADELDELNRNILIKLRIECVNFISSIEKDTTGYYYPLNAESHDGNREQQLIKPRYLAELWRVAYNFGIELQSNFVQFVTQDFICEFSLGLASFCQIWCEYVLNKTEEGHGRTTKPSWAKKGFQLMIEVFKPQYSQYLSSSELLNLRCHVEKCIEHVIGRRRVTHPSISISNTNSSLIKISRNTSKNEIAHRQSPHKRFNTECKQLDQQILYSLAERKLIGHVLVKNTSGIGTDVNEASKISVRRVDFRWQRGNKIGSGQSGTVYSCVNLNTGEMMAMKEIQFRSNDVQTIKALADEITNIEGIKHENLVKFYGVELHRKEILIFMEFCGDKCTLDRISRESSGLPEELVRSYTNSLLRAVYTLHENNIIHRDIKGANIFLKTIEVPSQPNNKHKTILKLGDFGSSIKFKCEANKNNALFAKEFTGTLSYMAPEVMMASGFTDGTSGYTFSADIWSVGCVVIEMFTGKRPWHPYRDEAIMLQVFKNHQQPPFPPNINKEAEDFLKHCLEFDPSLRWSASNLLNHPFVKIAESSF